ncbi:MAG: recombinase family protein [Candidatus Peribacter sp.]|nr:recombinase family protein [Candidatus Peribacter sp.]
MTSTDTPQALIGYSRVSTDGQREGYGIKIQEEKIKAYAEEKGLSVLRMFRDEGVSGALKDRPALLQLLNFVDENRKMRLGVCFLRLDRLSRSLVISEQLIADFQKRRVDVISLEEPDLLSNEPNRKLFRQFKAMMAEYEKEMITARMSAGRLKKVQEGNGYAGGRVAFGFRANGDDYVPVPDELAVVREIFSLRRKPRNGERLGYQRIAKLLNKKYTAIRTFNAMTVRYIVNNPFYKGFQHYGTVSTFNERLRVV